SRSRRAFCSRPGPGDTGAMAKRRVARWVGAAASTAALIVLLSACGGTGYNYVKSSDFQTFFRVPSDWKVYDEKTVVDTFFAKDLTKDQRSSVLDNSWRTMFDANPRPSLKHVFRLGRYPTGFAVSTKLSAQDSDSASDGYLRNFFIDIDKADQE